MTFSRDASFYGARFEGEAAFQGAVFERASFFSPDQSGHFVNFGSRADFSHTTFGQQADFGECRFFDDAEFMQARFEGNAVFVARFSVEWLALSVPKFWVQPYSAQKPVPLRRDSSAKPTSRHCGWPVQRGSTTHDSMIAPYLLMLESTEQLSLPLTALGDS